MCEHLPVDDESVRPGTVVVTGAASGIGEATAALLAGGGAGVAAAEHVVVLDRNGEGAEAVAASIGATAVCVDVADAEAVQAAFDGPLASLPAVTGLVNNAGIGNLKSLEQYSPAEVELIWAVNVAGTYNCLRSAAPSLRANGGAVVNVASVSGVKPTMGEAPYSAAKAAIVALTSSVALEWAPEVRANCVSPGFVRTPLNDVVTANDEWCSGIESRTPARRLGTADETAELIAFLLSDRAAYMTGQNIVLDGGSMLSSKQMDPLFEGLLGHGPI